MCRTTTSRRNRPRTHVRGKEELLLPQDTAPRTVSRMGIFSRKQDVPGEVSEAVDALLQLDRMWSQSPGHVIHHFVAKAADPLTTIAHALVLLAADGTLTPQALQTLGIDERELSQLVAHITGPAPAQSLRYEADVAEARADYERQLDEILAETNTILDEELRGTFRVAVARFAYENQLTNFKIAYRLMKAEGNDPLAGLPKTVQNPGYL